ncbi:hypothetical protein BN6_51550 [Saccharothrix espanaensis DSM 44229]|uniref:Uncharacterized protein n=2 Tax=Saccharothrix espanaensis TaxID=103731 RepID=K0K247_SACES|nr:hypothetical protein BN6_51550 [Saccharothrix espanaensis DSM 44229]
MAWARWQGPLSVTTRWMREMPWAAERLVVLDNAATAEQVVPLLPGGPSCTVLVTGRHRLVSLIDRHDARHLTLGVLTPPGARALLSARIGADRVVVEPGAVDEVVGLCGGDPLAVFGLLGIAPGADTTLPVVVALTGLSPAHARAALSTLDEASLLERRSGGRYAMHDLVRDYADTTVRGLPQDVREAALVRVTDFHLHTAHTAERLLNPHRELLPPDPPASGVRPQALSDATTAAAWLAAEHTTLPAVQRAAAALGRHRMVCQLA